jgi:2-haloacid dehalogenase
MSFQRSLGISTVWVNRRSARPGVGAVIEADGKPDLEVPDVATLADLALES